MPTVSVAKADILRVIDAPGMTDEQFGDLCFRFGIELDEVTTEAEEQLKETNRAADDASHEVLYKIDIPANRYDLLCLEGIGRALRIFLGKSAMPTYRAVAPADMLRINVRPATAQIRPYVVCAVLRDITFTETSYKSFIALQDKLHQNLCRRRKLVAIGTHDLDTISGPFVYDARAPTDISFVALKQSKLMNAVELLDLYERDAHLRPFVPLIKDSPVYPVIYDANGVVLSMPPIINGEHSKITLKTRNVFIESTALDRTKAYVVLNTLLAMFSEYCAAPFTYEPVLVHYEDGSSPDDVTPHADSYDIEASVEYINQCTGLQQSADAIREGLLAMQLPSSLKDDDTLTVHVPITRSDVLHACDVMEDVAIAYGFDNLPAAPPNTMTVGKELPMNKLSDAVRSEIGMAGFTEILTFALNSHDESFKCMRLEPVDCVEIANPKTPEYQVARMSLLPSMLKTLSHNRSVPLPIRLFEVSDVVMLDADSDTGARNERKVCASYSAVAGGFEVIHGLVDRIMLVLGSLHEADVASARVAPLTVFRYVRAQHPSYIDSHCAAIEVRPALSSSEWQRVGVFGALHPEVISNFDLKVPVCAVEFSLGAFL